MNKRQDIIIMIIINIQINIKRSKYSNIQFNKKEKYEIKSMIVEVHVIGIDIGAIAGVEVGIAVKAVRGLL